jgi:hypothetical protein
MLELTLLGEEICFISMVEVREFLVQWVYMLVYS